MFYVEQSYPSMTNPLWVISVSFNVGAGVAVSTAFQNDCQQWLGSRLPFPWFTIPIKSDQWFTPLTPLPSGRSHGRVRGVLFLRVPNYAVGTAFPAGFVLPGLTRPGCPRITDANHLY
jgi:hypothetical protein